MLSQGFADVTRGITVDPAAFARDMRQIAPAPRCYVVLFSPRSGSSWLTSLLSGRLGYPHEFLNPGFVRDNAVAMDATTPAGFLQMLQRRRCTPNGIFGMEARFIDIHALGEDAFTQAFSGHAVFFNLWRENLVAQGISLYRATATRRFHSNSAAGTAEPPVYDRDGLRFALGQVLQAENDNLRLLRRMGVAARSLRYEDIVQDRDTTIRMFCRAVGEPYDLALFASDATGELSKIGDDWNLEAEDRFRGECAEELAAMEGSRLMRRGLPGAPPFAAPEQPALQSAWRQGLERAAIGADPFANPYPPQDQQARHWLQGWRSGWDNQVYLAPESVQAQEAASRLPEGRDGLFQACPHPVPAPLHDYTAERLAEILQDQLRLGLAGALLEIGLSRGRQTATLLEAARADGSPLIGLDPGTGFMRDAIGGFLRRRMEGQPGEWNLRQIDLAAADPAQMQDLAGVAARFVAIDCSHAPHQVGQAMALAETLVSAEGCVAVSDFLQPRGLAVTERLFAYFATQRLLVPFALLPGRLLLAPAPVAARYCELMLALAVRDRVAPISARFIESLSKNGGAALNQTLFGSRIIVLS